MKKKCKVHCLPHKDGVVMNPYQKHRMMWRIKEGTLEYPRHDAQHLYFISDEKIKEGDWVLTGFPKHPSQVKKQDTYDAIKTANEDFECKKIIMGSY